MTRRLRAAVLSREAVQQIGLIWVAWIVVLISFQAAAAARIDLRTPDRALPWAGQHNTSGSNYDMPYVGERLLNQQVAWDSVWYLSIAVAGYDDPLVRSAPVKLDGEERELSLSYAFMPLYPVLMRIGATPLQGIGLNPIAAAAVSGVLISVLGTLGAALAMWDIARRSLGDRGGVRAAVYMLVFPTAFFLASVYSEGLFLGLALGSLALAQRRMWALAGLLAALAAFTRPLGVMLVLPLGWEYLQQVDWRSVLARRPLLARPLPRPSRETVVASLALVAPGIVFLAWQRSFLGRAFHAIEVHYGRRAFDFDDSIASWYTALAGVAGSNPQMTVYYAGEIASVTLAVIACVWALRRYPGLALFGLVSLLLAVTSGVNAAVSLSRYVLSIPVVFLMLASLGRFEAFDRIWTLGSAMGLALLAMLFAFNFWVA